jgi:hypothetical protein
MPFRDQDPLERARAINRFQRIDPQRHAIQSARGSQ